MYATLPDLNQEQLFVNAKFEKYLKQLKKKFVYFPLNFKSYLTTSQSAFSLVSSWWGMEVGSPEQQDII